MKKLFSSLTAASLVSVFMMACSGSPPSSDESQAGAAEQLVALPGPCTPETCGPDGGRLIEIDAADESPVPVNTPIPDPQCRMDCIRKNAACTAACAADAGDGGHRLPPPPGACREICNLKLQACFSGCRIVGSTE